MHFQKFNSHVSATFCRENKSKNKTPARGPKQGPQERRRWPEPTGDACPGFPQSQESAPPPLGCPAGMCFPRGHSLLCERP